MNTEVMCIHCLASISDNQKKTELPCGHRFHFACQFDHRLETGVNSCLVCNSTDNGANSTGTPLSNVLAEDLEPVDTKPPPVPTPQPPSFLPQSQFPPPSTYLPSSSKHPVAFHPQFINGATNEPFKLVLVDQDGTVYPTNSLQLPMARQRFISRSPSPVPSSGTYRKRCYYSKNCRNPFCTYRHPEKCNFDIICNNDYCGRWHPLRNKQRHDEDYLSD
uniref:RING-type domain-containing protein n=1 Tax=Panagrellus redivivus TaxID=6233 RepID=A0A7E4ZTV0_PANRE